MRIAYFSDNFFPEITGIADSIITTGQELTRRGHEVVYVAPRYSEKDYRYVHNAEMEKSSMHDARKDLPGHRLPSLQFPGSPTGQSRFVIPMGTSIRYLRSFKPDVIHTQSPFGTGLEALWAARRLHVPLVGTNHTPIEEFIGYSPIGGDLPSKMARRFFAWYYDRCAYVSAPYPGLIESMKEAGFKSKAHAIANPYLSKLFTRPTASEKEAAKVRRGLTGPVILYSGRLAPEKHIDVIIKALAQVRKKIPATLVITGHGIAEIPLRTLAKELNMEECVRFTGFVGFERLCEFYHAADVFVIMSTAETQSLALMQAYGSALPAIVARARGLVHYTPPECGYLIEPGDLNALVESMERLLADANLRATMGHAGAEFVKRFTPGIIADEWEAIYRSVI